MDEDQDEEAVERRKKRAKEILRLREDVGAARNAQNRKDAEREAARRKEEAMHRVLLGREMPRQSGEPRGSDPSGTRATRATRATRTRTTNLTMRKGACPWTRVPP